MLFSTQHPGTRALRKQIAWAQATRMLDGFRSPRRLALSLIALVLGLLWVGQAAAGIFLRGAAEPAQLTAWLAMGMFGFASWNLLKVVFRKPVEPFEWTLAEKEWLVDSPLTRRQLIEYRLAAIASAATFKAGLFSVIMIPDLTFFVLGFVGMFIGLMLIEFLRMIGEVAIWGMTNRGRWRLKAVVGLVAGAAIASAIGWLIAQYTAGEFTQLFSLPFINCVKQGLIELPNTPIGGFATVNFRWVAEAMLATSITTSIIGKLVAVGLIAGGLWRLLIRIDALVQQTLIRRMQTAWSSGLVEQQASVAEQEHIQLMANRDDRVRLPRWGGAGGLVWRQWLGAMHYRSSVLVAMIVPAILALSPAFNCKSDLAMMQQIVVLISCYSFLLLPTAFKFDFRRDLDRMFVLKAIPAKPRTIVWGQIAVPVLLTSAFQLAILLIAMAINPYHIGLLFSALLILIPCNVLIFATENLMFLWYPYRVSEEGLRVFLRTILAFTAKGILMAIGMGLALAVYLLSRLVAAWFVGAVQIGTVNSVSLTLFSVLATVGLTAAALFTVQRLARAFDSLDLSIDLNSVQAS